MAIFTLPDGSTVETKDSQELREVLAALKSNASPTVVNNANLNPSNNQGIPSVDDFRKAIQDPILKKFLDFARREGSSGIISVTDFKNQTGKKSLSGLGQMFKSTTGGASLASCIN
ncbi:MAG: hypothetical protein WBA07_27525 [Rivularia sp. (in: cyanobacteria)]